MQKTRAEIDLHQGITTCKRLFSRLNSLPAAELNGIYQAAFIGPGWLRAIAPKGLVLGRLGGWWGKQFDGRNHGRNIVYRQGRLQPVIPIQVSERLSLLDGRLCLTVCYPAGSPFPWPHVVDELRRLPDGRLLGMTIANLPGLRWLGLPFQLQPHPIGPAVDQFQADFSYPEPLPPS